MTAEAVAGTTKEKPPLDDVMLAMDVVDTLRRRQRLVERELDETGREEDLKQRLKRIYAQQGIDVPDHVLEQGVAALKEDRFRYEPLQGGFARRLALIYISRGRWGKWLGGGAAAAVLAAAVNYFVVVAPQQALPNDLVAAHAQAVGLSQSAQARERLQQVLADGQAALRAEDNAGARAALDELRQLQRKLDLEYTIQIVNRPDQQSGVWRIPDVNTRARNYYLVVEAVARNGDRLEVEVANEETGASESVSLWGLRVDESTFESVKRDKQDDGIIENDRVGSKQRGFLEPRYEFPTTGGTITRW
ncbi:MAG: hypothetical protein KDI88_18640 [Gammaproteobacteria bacterium]|nr:hypothetical protein [Gammaproteobacteria bacterium]